MRVLLTVPVIGFLLAWPAAAQIDNPGGAAPGMPQPKSGRPSPVRPNTTDRLFVQLTAIGGRAEVEAGKTAENKAQSGSVKEFARRMVQDHGKAEDKLASLANEADIRMPDELDEAHKSMQGGLQQAHDGDFDLAYIRGQIEEHQKAVQLLEWEINSGQYADLQRLAVQILPTVLAHLEMAQRLATSLTGQGPPTTATTGSVPPSGDKPHSGGTR